MCIFVAKKEGALYMGGFGSIVLKILELTVAFVFS